MNRLKEMLQYLIQAMSRAIYRFPLTVICLVGATALICYMISLKTTPSLVIQKTMFTLLVGAFIGMVAQFATERFEKLSQVRLAVYGMSALLTIGYFMILWPALGISVEIGTRTFVAVFAMLCAVLWVPSYKDAVDFNQVALIHFKSAFTSILYSGVLSAGIAAIITAINVLLFSVNSDAYAYMLTFVWVMFATLYYLSLLPRFNSKEELDIERMQTAKNYPKFLEILVSYIAIPLLAAYTVVLFAYFIKILVTLHWPSGQLGPMVLIYSAVGLLLFVLASLLDNRFADLYRKIFPKILIPVVIMQLISVGIRLNAYGITGSRYYVALFGIFSIVIGVMLSVKPITKNAYIALLAAGFAIFSIIPPMDAFTVSRVSQITRVQNILQTEGMLSEQTLTRKTNASEHTKIETTNILSYLDRSNSLGHIEWLPEDFNIYQDMESVFGFQPTYPNHYGYPEPNQFFYYSLDTQQPMIISSYDVSVNIHSRPYTTNDGINPLQFTLEGIDYEFTVEQISNQDTRIAVVDVSGTELIGTDLYPFIEKLMKTGSQKQPMPQEAMTLDIAQDEYKLRIIFQHIDINARTGPDEGVNFSATVFFADSKI